MPPFASSPAPKLLVADTCGQCKFTSPIAEDLSAVTCAGMPPTPQMVGPNQVIGLRPTVPRSLAACALFVRKLVTELHS